jgi:LPS sulfotransferase NodH
MVWYRSLFDGQKGIRGDITPQYSTLDERGVEYVRKVVGERCKIFLVIREPVSRSWSAVKMLYRYKGIDIREEEPSKIIKEMQYPYTLLRSDYSRMISTWKTYFGNGEFRIFYYDDLIRDKIAFLDEICDYVGVSNTNWRSPTLNKVSNYDVQDIKIPMAVKIEMSRFFMPELEKLSNMVGGYTEDWLMKAKKITD